MQQNNRLQFEIEGKMHMLSSLQVQQAMDSPCSSFEGEIVGQSPHGLCGKEATILLEDRTFSVLIEAVQAELGAQATKIRISGRDLTGVLVDSSADAREFNGTQDLSEIAKKLCEPFGIQIRSEAGDLPLRDFKISPGERVYEALERGARVHGVFFLPTNGTQLTIISPAKNAPAPLADFPIVSATYKKDISEHYGEYIVQSQNFALFAEPNVEKRSLDREISPRKKLIVVSPEENPQARADMERDIRKNRGEEVEITLPGIGFFPIGRAIKLQHHLLTGTYLVKSLRLQVDTTQGSSKRESVLSLKPVVL